MTQQPMKQCPQCGLVTPLNTPACTQCGHQFRTQFTQATQQTQMIIPPPQQPPLQQYPQYTPFVGYDMITRPPGSHSALAAGALSCLGLLGGGQMYNGQVIKGLVNLAVSFVLWIITLLLFLLPLLIFIPFWLLVTIDAVCIAQRLNRGEPVGQWKCF